MLSVYYLNARTCSRSDDAIGAGINPLALMPLASWRDKSWEMNIVDIAGAHPSFPNFQASTTYVFGRMSERVEPIAQTRQHFVRFVLDPCPLNYHERSSDHAFTVAPFRRFPRSPRVIIHFDSIHFLMPLTRRHGIMIPLPSRSKRERRPTEMRYVMSRFCFSRAGPLCNETAPPRGAAPAQNQL